MKKRVLSVILSAVLATAMLTACGSGEKVYNVGVCQLVEHPALDAATNGFKDALTEKLGEGNVKFDIQNAQGEQNIAATICNGFVSSNCDLILANATSPLQAAASATSTIPVLGTSVTDYQSALELADWDGTTGRNISGTSDLAPIEEQEAMLKELFPDAKKVGLLFCTAESNSAFQIGKFKAALDNDGIAYVEYGIADSNEIQSVVTAACQECDVLYVPTDNTLANNTESIKSIVIPAGIPVITGEEGMCKGCGVATLSIDYYQLGRATGEMAYEILVNKADITKMEVKYSPEVTKKYNAEICSQLGINVPEGYEVIE